MNVAHRHRNHASEEAEARAARQRILLSMVPGREYTSGDMGTLTGIDERRAAHALHMLRTMGLIERTRDRPSVYRRPV
jgi:Fic family protein